MIHPRNKYLPLQRLQRAGFAAEGIIPKTESEGDLIGPTPSSCISPDLSYFLAPLPPLCILPRRLFVSYLRVRRARAGDAGDGAVSHAHHDDGGDSDAAGKIIAHP